MDQTEFKVYGNKELLDYSKINIYQQDENGKKQTETLFYLGELKEFKPNDEIAVFYEVYISYKDSLVNTLKFENVMRNANDHVNHIYIQKENDEISVIYIGRESEIETQKGFRTVLIPLNKYLELNHITSEKDKESTKNKFYDMF